jgi:cyclophilin family peptidyl-prolyl cis-trans isomerase
MQSDDSTSSSDGTESSGDFSHIAVSPVLKHHSMDAPLFHFEDAADNREYMFAIENQKRRPARSPQNNIVTSCITIACTLTILYFVGLRYNLIPSIKTKEAQDARDELIYEQERLLLQFARHRRMSKEDTDLLEHVAMLQEELEHTTSSLEAELNRRIQMEKEAKEIKQAAPELTDVALKIQDDQRRLYRTLILDRYGTGPHFVEFAVHVWEDGTAERGYFTVQMAPLEYMPASVFLFLEQVNNTLWDGSSFHINAPHVLLAQPLSMRPVEEHPVSKMERMGLARLPFPEYSKEYPHEPYTLGFGGSKTPGPNFYINKVDNTIIHAGEPCFGKVIIGKDIVDRLTSLTGSMENPYYIYPVDITRIRIVRDLNTARGGAEYLEFLQSLHDEH